VVERLMKPDMWSGWGIRTLSANHPAYNPHSYQNGSVWPHDNGIIAMGLRRYGFAEESARVAKAVLDAARCFVSYRLPELYAGIERHADGFPVQYLDANVPQAWAAGSVFHLIRALLGLRADAPHGLVTVDPALPDWLPDLALDHVRVGAASVDLRAWRDGDHTRWDVARREGELEVRQEPWAPWPAAVPEEAATAR
jgi:glycogen debranching enzyme